MHNQFLLLSLTAKKIFAYPSYVKEIFMKMKKNKQKIAHLLTVLRSLLEAKLHHTEWYLIQS